MAQPNGRDRRWAAATIAGSALIFLAARTMDENDTEDQPDLYSGMPWSEEELLDLANWLLLVPDRKR